MRDEHDDRLHQALRHYFASNIGDLAKSIAHAFDRLHERLYGAPWSGRTRPADPACKASRLTTR